MNIEKPSNNKFQSLKNKYMKTEVDKRLTSKISFEDLGKSQKEMIRTFGKALNYVKGKH
jgi:hypothetical protein